MFSALRKTFIAALLVCFTVAAVYVPQPFSTIQKAHALAVQETGPQLEATIMTRIQTTIGTAFDAAIENVTSLQWWRESVLKPMGWALAKAILSRMLKDIVRWINSGFRGSPMFVQDLGGFLTDVADETMGRFIQEVGGPFSIVCSPFRLNIQIALATAYSRSRDRNLRRCTLTGAMQNIQNFFNGDFSQGGWNTWLQIVHQPQNYTYLGAYYQAATEGTIAVEGARGERFELLRMGSGFLWGETCEDVATPRGTTERRCRINTPGVVISGRLQESLSYGERSLIAADEIDEVINAFLQQVAVQAITGANGLLGLGGGDPRYTNPSFNIDTYPDTVDTGALATGGFTMEESLRTLTSYIDLASSTIARYDRQYTDDATVQARADATVAEARAQIPLLQSQLVTLQNIINRYNAATSSPEQTAILQEYGTYASSLPTATTVSGKRTLWDYGLSGMKERPLDHVDRNTLRDAKTREEKYLTMAKAALDQYLRVGRPSADQMQAAGEIDKAIEEIQSNLSQLSTIIADYESGDREAARTQFRWLRSSLSTESQITQSRTEWQALFGQLP